MGVMVLAAQPPIKMPRPDAYDAAALAACPTAAALAAPGCPGSKMDVRVLPANAGSAGTVQR